MPTLGETLREAREAKGLSIADLAKKTHIMTKQLEGLETDDFSRIPAPIYVKSFIKTFSQQVGLDPNEMVELYTEQMKAGAKPPAPKAELKVRKPKNMRRPKASGLKPVGPADADAPSYPETEAPSRPRKKLFGGRDKPDKPDQPEQVPVEGATNVAASAAVPAAATTTVEEYIPDVGEVREPKPSLSAVLAAKWRAFRTKLKAPAFLKRRPFFPALKIPFTDKILTPEAVRHIATLALSVLALGFIIFGLTMLSPRVEPDETFGMGELRDNPVITDPPLPYFAFE